ncbi:hypothetical protein FRC06_000818 [Ceratobasidium sp. 370]|nr:hypothetical protein FRC06_000818 [Ceratobasidium sp. 370]
MQHNVALGLSVLACMVSPAVAAATKVMFLGDSITGSPGCWRALLWNKLQTAGKTNIDFVGTLPAQGCGVAYDGDNEGHGGYLATNIANQNQLPPWLAATTPDIVAMTLGTNDVSAASWKRLRIQAYTEHKVWSNIAPSTITTAFSKLVDQMRASKPTMKILVAKITPMNPSGCSDCAQRVVNFNNALPAWASSKTTSSSPITVVDLWTGYNTTSDTYDGVHPNDNGNAKIASKYYTPLYNIL